MWFWLGSFSLFSSVAIVVTPVWMKKASKMNFMRKGVHQVLPGADENESEHNRADDPKLGRAVLEVAGRAIDAEYHVGHEEVVKGEHPLRQVACHPRHGEPNPPSSSRSRHHHCDGEDQQDDDRWCETCCMVTTMTSMHSS